MSEIIFAVQAHQFHRAKGREPRKCADIDGVYERRMRNLDELLSHHRVYFKKVKYHEMESLMDVWRHRQQQKQLQTVCATSFSPQLSKWFLQVSVSSTPTLLSTLAKLSSPLSCCSHTTNTYTDAHTHQQIVGRRLSALVSLVIASLRNAGARDSRATTLPENANLA